MYKNNLCFAPASIDACALWRMWMPHLNIPDSRFLFTEGFPDIHSMAECDILVIQRLMSDANISFLQLARKYGIKIIYDLDDNVWNLPPDNPAATFFHNDESTEGLRNCAEWADAITVSTFELKCVVQKKWRGLKNVQTGLEIPVVHIDNCVDTKLFSLPVLEKDPDKIVIGWAGSNTHSGDLGRVWALLPQILYRFPQVHLEFVGMEPPPQIKHHVRVKERPWAHVSEFHNRYATWNWDIALAPLQHHPFNRSKSCIKMQEAGSIARPCLATRIAPYEYFCGKSKGLDWLLCEDWEWEKKLVKLITDKSLREDLGMLSYVNTITNFSIERSAEQWQALAQSLG